jgi:hypothetical protein
MDFEEGSPTRRWVKGTMHAREAGPGPRSREAEEFCMQ